MAEYEDRVVEVRSGTPGWLAPAVALLAILGIAGLGLAWHDATQLQALQQSVNNQFKTEQQNTSQQLATIDQRQTQAEAASAGLTSDLGVVTKRVRVTQGELAKARTEAAQIRDDAAQKLAQLAETDTDVKNQLATKATSDDLTATNGNLNGVKTDLEGTKNDLKMARSDMGTLIARNHDEIDQLRRLGEREYVEFSIQGRGKPQKVGGLTVELRSVDVKKNQFTIAVVADDMRTEKKNRLVNEPVFFYTRGARQASELVVNSVAKDKVTGYVSMPKVSAASTTASSD